MSKNDGTVHLVSITSTSTRVRLLDLDADGDGVADATDDFPDDAGQTTDSDGDGYGDNTDLPGGDAFPTTPRSGPTVTATATVTRPTAQMETPSQTMRSVGRR